MKRPHLILKNSGTVVRFPDEITLDDYLFYDDRAEAWFFFDQEGKPHFGESKEHTIALLKLSGWR